MGALIEGLDDYVESELDRIRSELRAAINDSDYTFEQVASLAGIGASTLYAILTGRHASGGGLDTLLRVAFIVGTRIELSGSAKPSFQLAPLTTGSRRSSRSSARGATDIAARSATKQSRKASKQGKRRATGGGNNKSYVHLAA